MPTLGDLLIRIGADVATFEALKSNLHGTADSLEEFAKSAESVAIVFESKLTLPIEQVAEKILTVGENFHNAQNTLISATGAMGEQLQQLNSDFALVFETANETAVEVGGVMGGLAAKLDLTGDSLVNLSKQILDLHDVTGEALGPLVADTTKLFKEWNVATDDQAAALDHLLQVSQATGTSVQQLESMLNTFGPVFKELGIGLQDTTNLIGSLSKAVADPEQALGALQKALAKMSKAGLKDPLEGLQALADRIKNANTEGQAFAIGATAFGKGAAGIVNAIREGKLDLDSFGASLKLNNRTIGDVAAQMEGLEQKFANFQNRVQTALKPLGEGLVDMFTKILAASQPLIDFITVLVDRFNSLPDGVKEAIVVFTALLAAIGPIASVIGGVAAAAATLAGPLAAVLGILGGPVGLVILAGLLAVAIGAWAFSHAITEANRLNTSLTSLYDLMDRGEKATKDQADEIGNLTAILAAHNKQVGAKQVTVSQTDAGDNVLPNATYIKNLQDAVKGLDDWKTGFTSTSKVVTDKSGVMSISLGALGDAHTATGAKVKKFSADTKHALDQLLQAPAFYKALDEELKKLQKTLEYKTGIGPKTLQIADLKRQVYAPTQTDADTQYAAYFAEVLKLNHASNIATSDETLTQYADLVAKLKIAGMDTQQAFSLLGVTSTADVNREIQEIQAAQARILQSNIASNDDRTRATMAALDKEISLWRSSGQAISDDVLITAARIKETWAATHLDIEQALSGLGIKSEQEISNSLDLISAQLDRVRVATAAGSLTQLDADNAEIASLQKKQQEFSSIGKAITDDEQARLSELLAIRQRAVATTEDAYKFLGLPSQQDLDQQIELIDSMYAKIRDDANASADQVNAARVAALSKEIADYHAAGVTVSDDMINEFKRRSTQAQITAMDIDQAFKMLGTISTQDLIDQLALLGAAFQKVATDASSTPGQIATALVTNLQGQIDALRKAGQAASDELVAQLDNAKQKVLAATMNIDDAYKGLGVTSSKSIIDAFNLAQIELEKIQGSAKASAMDLAQAEVAASEARFQAEVASGSKIDELQHAQTVLEKQRLTDLKNDTQNVYLALADVVKQSYQAIQGDLVDVLSGAKTLGAAFIDIGQQIEKAILNYVVKNLLLTDSTLNTIQKKLLSLFGELTGGSSSGGIGSSVASVATGSSGSAASGAASGGFSASGLLGSLSSIANVVSAVADVIGGIVQGFQMAHLITIAGRIEESTRYVKIATTEGGDSISQTSRMSSLGIAETNKILWSPIAELLRDISSNLDAINTNVGQLVAFGGTGGGGGGTGGSTDAGLAALVQQLQTQLLNMESSISASGGAYSAMQNSLQQQLEAQQAIVTQDQQLLDSLKANLASGKATQDQISQASTNLAAAQDALTNISNQMSQSNLQNGGAVAEPTGSAAVDYSQLQGAVDQVSTAATDTAAAATSAGQAATAAAQAGVIAWAQQILPLLKDGAHVSRDTIDIIAKIAPNLAAAIDGGAQSFEQALLDMIDSSFTAQTATTQLADSAGDAASATSSLAGAALSGTNSVQQLAQATNTTSQSIVAVGQSIDVANSAIVSTTQAVAQIVAGLHTGGITPFTGGAGPNVSNVTDAVVAAMTVTRPGDQAYTPGYSPYVNGGPKGGDTNVTITGNYVNSSKALDELADALIGRLRKLGISKF